MANPSKHAGSDLEVFRLVNYGLYGQHAARIGPHHTCRIQLLHLFRFHSSKEDPDHIVLNQSESDLGGPVRFWPNASGLESSQHARIIGASCFTCTHRQQSQK